jgi:hypothetical protein
MFRLINYYGYKLIRLMASYFFGRVFAPGVKYRSGTHIPECLYLDHSDERVMHLGDMMFFLGIIWQCKQSNIPIFILGSRSLVTFFSIFGVRHTMTTHRPGIILTKSDSLQFIRPSKHTVMGFNFWQLSGTGPVAVLLQQQFQRFMAVFFPKIHLIIPSASFYTEIQQRVLDHLRPMGTKDSAPSIIVNPFVASQRWSAWRRRGAFNQYIQGQSKDYSVVCIGTNRDRLLRLGFPATQDMRGKMSVMALVNYLYKTPIHSVVTFDTFVAHIAILLDLNAVIFLKSTQKKQFRCDRFLPFFPCVTEKIRIK